MSARRLPPYAALRAFEAVARRLSFTRAAEELGVTQAAVSRQVAALERLLGVDLVERRPEGNRLTEAGQALYPALRESYDRIEEALRKVSAWPRRSVLTVSVAPFFSSVWLTPRIMDFIEAHPEIDLRLHHAYRPPEYARERVDCGINWGEGDWPNVEAEKFLDGSMAVVCAPTLASEMAAPAELLRGPLLYEFKASDWSDWLASAGVEAPQDLAMTRIDDTHALRRAALEGHGFALIIRSLVGEDLQLGRLVEPFSYLVDTGSHYYFNRPAGAELTSAMRAFRRWLFGAKGAAAASRQA